MAEIMLDPSYLEGLPARIGTEVTIRLPEKFVPFSDVRRSIRYMITGCDPLRAKPIAVTHFYYNKYMGCGGFLIHKTRTRRFLNG